MLLSLRLVRNRQITEMCFFCIICAFHVVTGTPRSSLHTILLTAVCANAEQTQQRRAAAVRVLGMPNLSEGWKYWEFCTVATGWRRAACTPRVQPGRAGGERTAHGNCCKPEECFPSCFHPLLRFLLYNQASPCRTMTLHYSSDLIREE